MRGKEPRERKGACLVCAIAEGLSTERGVLSAGNYLCRCSDSIRFSKDSKSGPQQVAQQGTPAGMLPR